MNDLWRHFSLGALILDRVTPVITALFGAFHLNEHAANVGRAHITRISED